jgi:hypothetical protein
LVAISVISHDSIGSFLVVQDRFERLLRVHDFPRNHGRACEVANHFPFRFPARVTEAKKVSPAIACLEAQKFEVSRE